jgi:glycosyltransferase involved in cell wall biosynthesis
MVDFPRVLFITPVAFNPFSGGGATFASLFQGWPKDRLATIHNDRAPSPRDVCEKYFVLSPSELDFIPPFSALRRRGGKAAQPHDDKIPSPPASSRPRWHDGARQLVLGDSIPERALLTKPLERWIADFNPQLIYTILGSNGMMSLIEQVRERFNLPLVVHIMDDWASAAHRTGLFAPIERPRMKSWLRHFFSVATECLGISPAMCEAYAKRYGRTFTPFQYALDRERWGAITKHDLRTATPPELLYVGSIFRNAQLDSLIDCARAVAEINNEHFPMRLRIVTSAANCKQYGPLLTLHPNIAVEISASDDDAFFQEISAADALLLPVNFDGTSVDFIRYSMPTKVPAYLNSGTPVLAYGSPETAQIRYAADAGWGRVVPERSLALLKDALKQIVSDKALRGTLSAAARQAAANHDARVVRAAFQELLCRNAKR